MTFEYNTITAAYCPRPTLRRSEWFPVLLHMRRGARKGRLLRHHQQLLCCGDKTERWGEMPKHGGDHVFWRFFHNMIKPWFFWSYHVYHIFFILYDHTIPCLEWYQYVMEMAKPNFVIRWWSSPRKKGEPNRNQGGMGWWSTADGAIFGRIKIISGWWLTYPSEKYKFVSWDDDIPKIWKVIKVMFQTTNQF